MRLIDADEYLKKVCTYKKTGCGSCKFQIVCPVDEPIIKAIPVDWIMWVWRRNQPDDTQEDVWMRLGVLKMIKDWEKENANDN